MKRCPDCGFRAKDNTCPLCGVRMQNDPAIYTHTHNQTGERCGVTPKETRGPVQTRPAENKAYTPPTAMLGDLGKGALKIIGYIAAFLILSGGCSAFF